MFKLGAFRLSVPNVTKQIRRQKSHYDVLRVSTSAKPEDIKRAYLKLCKRFHPDVNPDPEAAEKFRLVNSTGSRKCTFVHTGFDEYIMKSSIRLR